MKRPDYETVCIMLSSMSSVMNEIEKLENSIVNKVSQTRDCIKSSLAKMAQKFIDNTTKWVDEWINSSMNNISKHLILSEFSMKTEFYKSDFQDDDTHVADLLTALNSYVDIFNENLNENLREKLIEAIGKQYIQVLLWILLYPRSKRKYYRSWILNEKTNDAQQKLIAHKLLEDLQEFDQMFINVCFSFFIFYVQFTNWIFLEIRYG